VIDYESRSDSFEDYRSGFLIKTGRRASKISVENAPFVDLSMQSSALMDLDGDSLTDLINQASASKWE